MARTTRTKRSKSIREFGSLKAGQIISLEELTDYWRRYLNLYGWRVRVFWEPSLEAQGRVYWEGQLLDATILIRPLVPGERRSPIEKTLIHELYHIHYAPLGDPPPERVEESVETMAWLTYNAAHGLPLHSRNMKDQLIII